jgi:hypothetical protein
VGQILKCANNEKVKSTLLPLIAVCFNTDFEQTCLQKKIDQILVDSHVHAGVCELDITS